MNVNIKTTYKELCQRLAYLEGHPEQFIDKMNMEDIPKKIKYVDTVMFYQGEGIYVITVTYVYGASIQQLLHQETYKAGE